MKVSTQTKLRMARLASKTICFCRGMVGLPSKGVFSRRNINYELDLNEGIDLAIFLFGSFEPDVVAHYSRVLGNGSVAIDVGANVGAHTLRMAELCGESGMVIAVEPTTWAFEKLKINMALNPLLRPRIRAVQAFLGPSSDRALPSEVCSSWPMNVSSNSKDARSEGRSCSTTGAISTSLDELAHQIGIPKVDFLKVDVDGHEIDVLDGASETLRCSKPGVVIELAPYVYPDGDKSVLRILQTLADAGYVVASIGDRHFSLSRPDEILGSIPTSGGINCLIQ
jgi:FkbM family methyltransferase